jgi:hypothetical protein
MATRLIVSFGSSELLAYCSRLDAAEELLGSAYAQVLLTLIADIEAHDDAAELIAFFGESAKVEGDSLWLKIWCKLPREIRDDRSGNTCCKRLHSLGHCSEASDAESA